MLQLQLHRVFHYSILDQSSIIIQCYHHRYTSFYLVSSRFLTSPALSLSSSSQLFTPSLSPFPYIGYSLFYLIIYPFSSYKDILYYTILYYSILYYIIHYTIESFTHIHIHNLNDYLFHFFFLQIPLFFLLKKKAHHIRSQNKII